MCGVGGGGGGGGGGVVEFKVVRIARLYEVKKTEWLLVRVSRLRGQTKKDTKARW